MIKSNGISPSLIKFARSIKEMEGLIRQVHQEKLKSQDLGDDLPEKWRSVFHMARVAPALANCLKECVCAIESELLNQENGETSDVLINLLENCDSVLSIVSAGVRPVGHALH